MIDRVVDVTGVAVESQTSGSALRAAAGEAPDYRRCLRSAPPTSGSSRSPTSPISNRASDVSWIRFELETSGSALRAAAGEAPDYRRCLRSASLTSGSSLSPTSPVIDRVVDVTGVAVESQTSGSLPPGSGIFGSRLVC